MSKELCKKREDERERERERVRVRVRSTDRANAMYEPSGSDDPRNRTLAAKRTLACQFSGQLLWKRAHLHKEK
jgi:hypothetical protein